MERKDLLERLNILSSEIQPLIEKHTLYSGRMELNSGIILSDKEVNPKNVQLRESVQALADIYPKAIEYITLGKLALECEGDSSYEEKSEIEIKIIIFSALVQKAKEKINYSISKLPN